MSTQQEKAFPDESSWTILLPKKAGDIEKDKGDKCSICLDRLQLVVRLSCNHEICYDCVVKNKEKLKNCPLCQKDIDAEVKEGNYVYYLHILVPIRECSKCNYEWGPVWSKCQFPKCEKAPTEYINREKILAVNVRPFSSQSGGGKCLTFTGNKFPGCSCCYDDFAQRMLLRDDGTLMHIFPRSYCGDDGTTTHAGCALFVHPDSRLKACVCS